MEGFKCIKCTLYFNFFIQFWTSSYVQNIFSLLQNEVKIWNLFFVFVSSYYSFSARAGTKICYTKQTYILMTCMSLCQCVMYIWHECVTWLGSLLSPLTHHQIYVDTIKYFIWNTVLPSGLRNFMQVIYSGEK
jgi:hypothetical protein